MVQEVENYELQKELGRGATARIYLARNLTTCVLDFVRDQVTPVAEWVTWTGGDPEHGR